MAATGNPSSTASSWAAISRGATGSQARTPRPFWAVTAVIAVRA
jgi:hypothetical protein